MSNYPAIIHFGRAKIRTITMNGVTKFVARDFCRLLGYPRADKMLNPFVDTPPEYISFMTAGGTQSARVVELSDMEKVLDHCNHRNAKKFRDWLRSHAVPEPRGFVAFVVAQEA